MGLPNKRVQRTRLRSPLTRHSLGRRSLIWPLVASCFWTMVLLGRDPSPVPAVKGVSLGTLRGAVIEALGKPASTSSGRDTEMGQGSTLGLSYPGLTVELCEAGGRQSRKLPKDLHVWRMTISGKAWEMSPGIRVGMSRPEIEAALGATTSVSAKGEEQVLHCSPFQFDAWLTVTLRDGVVVEIQMAEDWS